ncbi:MAG: hypothetical protein ACRD7E_18715 [Bryobacteraceae bacterium]
MCWYSAEHSGHQLVNAEVGERLSIRQMRGGYLRWVVRESDLTEPKPAAVCLVNGTRVLFRPSEADQAALGMEGESEAVFRMLRNPRRDLFELPNGREFEVNSLPTGLVFDVLVVPGKEPVSAILAGDAEPADELMNAAQPTAPVLVRVRRLLQELR